MNEVLSWLKAQNGGIGTYIGLQQRAYHLVSTDPEHAAVFQLLAGLAARFVSAYDGVPLSVDVANRAFERVVELVEKAAKSMHGTPEEKLRVLNEIAKTNL